MVNMKREKDMIKDREIVRKIAKEIKIDTINMKGNTIIEMTEITKKIMPAEIQIRTMTKLEAKNSEVVVQVIITETTVHANLPIAATGETTQIDRMITETTFRTANTSVLRVNQIGATKAKNPHKPKSQIMKGIIDVNEKFLHFFILCCYTTLPIYKSPSNQFLVIAN